MKKGGSLQPSHRYTPSYFFSKYLYPMVLKLCGEGVYLLSDALILAQCNLS